MSKGGDQNTNVYSILDIKRAGPVLVIQLTWIRLRAEPINHLYKYLNRV